LGLPIVYLDESGINRYMSRTHARAPRGKSVTIKRPGKRYKRLNIVAAQCEGEIIAPYVYEWSTNAVWFETWFEWHLCPSLKSKSVIIMDNAKFHRKTRLSQIAKFYGFLILWLPPYSPDKNDIEPLWANLKKFLQNNSQHFDSMQTAIRDYFQSE